MLLLPVIKKQIFLLRLPEQVVGLKHADYDLTGREQLAARATI